MVAGRCCITKIFPLLWPMPDKRRGLFLPYGLRGYSPCRRAWQGCVQKSVAVACYMASKEEVGKGISENLFPISLSSGPQTIRSFPPQASYWTKPSYSVIKLLLEAPPPEPDKLSSSDHWLSPHNWSRWSFSVSPLRELSHRHTHRYVSLITSGFINLTKLIVKLTMTSDFNNTWIIFL